MLGIFMNSLNKIKKKVGSVGEKKVEFLNLTDGDIILYNKEKDKFINGKVKSKTYQWMPNTNYEKGQLIVFDDMLYWVVKDHHSQNNIDFDMQDGNVIPFITESGAANVIALDYSIAENKASISWTNPDSASYEGREIFISNINIMSLKRDEIFTLYSSAPDDFIYYNLGIGTDVGSAENLEMDVPPRSRLYLKVFVKHNIDEEIVYSTGRYLELANPDIIPPPTVVDLRLESINYGEGIKLNWTNPIGEDFSKSFLVKSLSDIPSSLEDGTILGTFTQENCEFIDYDVKRGEYHYSVFAQDSAGDGYGNGTGGNLSAPASVSTVNIPLYGYDFKNKTKAGLASKIDNFDDISFFNLQRGVLNESGLFVPLDDGGIRQDNLTQVSSQDNVLVKVPDVYYDIQGGTVLLAEEQIDGVNQKMPSFYIGAFESSYGQNGELRSSPFCQVASVDFRDGKHSLGDYDILDFKKLAILRTMIAMEYGLDVQNIGGRAESSGAIETGGTIPLDNNTGEVGNSVSYRGIENLWGNTATLINGMLTDGGVAYQSAGNYDSYNINQNDFGDYSPVGSLVNGYIGTINPISQVGDVLVDSASGIDYQDVNEETALLAFGGFFDSGKSAGLYSLNKVSFGAGVPYETYSEEKADSGKTRTVSEEVLGKEFLLENILRLDGVKNIGIEVKY